jgi:hypothetical protein
MTGFLYTVAVLMYISCSFERLAIIDVLFHMTVDKVQV